MSNKTVRVLVSVVTSVAVMAGETSEIREGQGVRKSVPKQDVHTKNVSSSHAGGGLTGTRIQSDVRLQYNVTNSQRR
jgi:hypothetical protein